jgi:hypothetical protein
MWVDEDRDTWGIGDPVVIDVCGEATGYAERPGDCNDQDPEAHLKGFRDQDADGWGDPAGEVCVDALPAGYVELGRDCDDTDSSIMPDAPEQFSDGIDSNCDGDDDPEDCSQPVVCACAKLTDPPDVEMHPDCPGQPDIYPAEVFLCDACGRPQLVYVVLANRGAAPSAAGVEVLITASEPVPPYVLEIPLAPGETTQPLMLDSRFSLGEVFVSVQVPGDAECETNNNSAETFVVHQDCQ